MCNSSAILLYPPLYSTSKNFIRDFNEIGDFSSSPDMESHSTISEKVRGRLVSYSKIEYGYLNLLWLKAILGC